LICEKN